MAEGARLESVYALTRIEGSNPSLSAINTIKKNFFFPFLNQLSYEVLIPTRQNYSRLGRA